MRAVPAPVSLIVRGLVRLYPSSFRQRWGSCLEAESRLAGWRSVPSLVAGALDIWLHPMVWPARTPAERRGRALVLAVAAAGVTSLLTHVLIEFDDPVAQGLRHAGSLQFSAGLLGLGFALVLPGPRIDRAVIRAVLRSCTPFLIPALAIGVPVVVAANGGMTDVGQSALRPVLLGLWWATLGLAAVAGCRAFAALTTVLRPAGVRRARAGLLCLIGSSVLGAGAVAQVAAAGDVGGSTGPLLSVGALLGGAAVLVLVLRDLASLPGRPS